MLKVRISELEAVKYLLEQDRDLYRPSLPVGVRERLREARLAIDQAVFALAAAADELKEIDATVCKCPPGTVTKPRRDERPVGHYGWLRNGVATCCACYAETPTTAEPPFTIKCSGCRRNVRIEAEPVAS